MAGGSLELQGGFLEATHVSFGVRKSSRALGKLKGLDEHKTMQICTRFHVGHVEHRRKAGCVRGSPFEPMRLWEESLGEFYLAMRTNIRSFGSQRALACMPSSNAQVQRKHTITSPTSPHIISKQPSFVSIWLTVEVWPEHLSHGLKPVFHGGHGTIRARPHFVERLSDPAKCASSQNGWVSFGFPLNPPKKGDHLDQRHPNGLQAIGPNLWSKYGPTAPKFAVFRLYVGVSTPQNGGVPFDFPQAN